MQAQRGKQTAVTGITLKRTSDNFLSATTRYSGLLKTELIKFSSEFLNSISQEILGQNCE